MTSWSSWSRSTLMLSRRAFHSDSVHLESVTSRSSLPPEVVVVLDEDEGVDECEGAVLSSILRILSLSRVSALVLDELAIACVCVCVCVFCVCVVEESVLVVVLQTGKVVGQLRFSKSVDKKQDSRAKRVRSHFHHFVF
jgi:hypothetical protein